MVVRHVILLTILLTGLGARCALAQSSESAALASELRALRMELAALRSEVAALRLEIARRPSATSATSATSTSRSPENALADSMGQVLAQLLSGARTGSATRELNSCVANMKQIDGAVQQWALENRKVATSTYSLSDQNLLDYLKGSRLPVCPSGGVYSAAQDVAASPSCSLHGNLDHPTPVKADLAGASLAQLLGGSKVGEPRPKPSSLATLFGAVPPEAREKAERLKCVNNLKQVVLALKIYANDNDDRYPFQIPTAKGGTMELSKRNAHGDEVEGYPHFAGLTNELGAPHLLTCPSDKARSAARSWQEFGPERLSYKIQTGQQVDETLPASVIVWCPVHHNYALVDGSVAQGNSQRLQEAINNGRHQAGLKPLAPE